MLTSTGKTVRLRADYVPTSFEDMFTHYYDYVVRLVATSGIEFQSAEDVAMTILEKFFAKGVLEDFNPEFTTEHGGVTRKAVFRTFLSGFVKTYVRHYVDRQRKQGEREGLSLDTPVFSYYDSGEPVTWADYLGPRYVEEFESLHQQELVERIRTKLQVSDPRNAQDQCDMLAFFNAVLQQTFDLGKVNAIKLSKQFGVSDTTIQNWLKRLRSEVGAVVEEQ